MNVRTKAVLAATVAQLCITGCAFKIDSAGTVCIPFCFSPGDTRVPKEVAKAEENGVRQILFTLTFNRSILTSVDNFFSRYNDDARDPAINEFLNSLANVGLAHVNEKFGANPNLNFVPAPKLSSVNGSLAYSQWVTRSTKPQAFETIRPILGTDVTENEYRWRIGLAPLFAYSRAQQDRAIVVVFFLLEVEQAGKGGTFSPVKTLDTAAFTKAIQGLVHAVLPAYKAYLIDTYNLEVL